MAVEQEMLDKIHQMSVERSVSDGWYPIGVLEWTDDIPRYSEAGTEGDDWVWVKQENRGETRLWWWSIGTNPVYGNTTCGKEPWSIIDILRYLVCSPVVAIGRPTERGTPVMGIPKGVRLKGMTEWIMREDKLKTV